MIVPSRFESMPYVVIEAAGASVPIISTDVGGIPEIFGSESDRLIPCDNVPLLAETMRQSIAMSPADRFAPALRLQEHIDENFSVEKMASTVLEAYAAARGRRGQATNAAEMERKAG
jgi:glycosyltransferase involved in cell wall biosynthesis